MGTIDASIVNVAVPHIRGSRRRDGRGDHLDRDRLRARQRHGDAADRVPGPALRPEARLPLAPRPLRRRLGALRRSELAADARRRSASSRASAPARCSRPSRPSCARPSRPRSRAWRWPSSAWPSSSAPRSARRWAATSSTTTPGPGSSTSTCRSASLGISMVWRFVHEPEDIRARQRRRRRSSSASTWTGQGIALLDLSRLAALQYVARGGAAQRLVRVARLIRACAITSALALALFVVRELTATVPAVDLRLFKDPVFLSATLVGAVMFAHADGADLPPAGLHARAARLHRDAVRARPHAPHARHDGRRPGRGADLQQGVGRASSSASASSSSPSARTR